MLPKARSDLPSRRAFTISDSARSKSPDDPHAISPLKSLGHWSNCDFRPCWTLIINVVEPAAFAQRRICAETKRRESLEGGLGRGSGSDDGGGQTAISFLGNCNARRRPGASAGTCIAIAPPASVTVRSGVPVINASFRPPIRKGRFPGSIRVHRRATDGGLGGCFGGQSQPTLCHCR